MGKQRRTRIVLFLAAAFALAGCSLNPPPKSASSGMTGELSYYGNVQQQYGDLLAVQFPDLTITQVAPDFTDAQKRGISTQQLLDEFLDSEKLDMIETYTVDDYERWSAEGKLYDLTRLIREDKYDMSDRLPIVTDTLKGKGGGRIFGLAPSFTSQALYYNKTLFDDYHVPYPKDRMSWEQVLELARKFPATGSPDTRIYGYHTGFIFSPSDFLMQVARTYGLSYLSADGKTLSMETPEWQSVFHMVMAAFRDGVLTPPMDRKDNHRYDKEDVMNRDLFGQGRAAMSESWGNVNQDQKLDWGMVTVPVDPRLPEATTALSPTPIFAISAKTKHLKEAWEVLKFINSRTVANIQAKSPFTSGYSSRIALLPKEKDGHSIESLFRQTKYDDRSTINRYNPNVPSSFTATFGTILEEETNAAYHGDKTDDEALQAIQQRGREALR